MPRIHPGRPRPRTGDNEVVRCPAVRGLSAPLMLAAARGRRRPARWLLPALGIALAVAFAAGVAAESQIAGDQSARSVLQATSPLDSEVRVTWQGAVSPGVADQARALLRGLGLGSPTEVVLMNPVRLDGVVVRPAAIAPLGQWLPGPAQGGTALGPCRAEALPDAARRRRPGPVDPGRDRRPYPGRRLGVAALGGAPRVRAVQRGWRAGARDHRCRRTGIAAGTERPVPDVQLAGAAPGDPAARVAAGRCRGPAGPRAGPPAAEREPVQPERAVHRTGPSAGPGEHGAAAAAARGRRRDRGAGAVRRPRGRRTSPRSAGRA